MANKRIKISELPKVTYDPTADIYLTKSDYLPISVTNKLDLTLKTSMAVTTRELQRFVLQQSANTEDSTNELTIGNTGSTVNINRLKIAENLTVSGTCIFTGGVTMSSITLDSGVFNRDIQVGGSVYPSRLTSSSGAAIPYGLLVANSSGFIKQSRATGMSLVSLIANAPVTAPLNAGRVATVDSTGKLNFSTGIGGLITSASGITNNPAEHYNVVNVSSDGGLASDSGVTVMALKTTVGAVSSTFSSNTDTISIALKFLTTTNETPSVDDIDVHDTLTLKKVNDTVDTVDAEFQETVRNRNKLLTTRATTPSLDDVEVAPTESILINTSVNQTYDATDIIDDPGGVTPRVIFNSPVVLGAKHPDDLDLTDETTNWIDKTGNKGPKDFPAQVGEIRWNIYNGVPTIYLAVKKMNLSNVVAVPGACHWYGVPLFGTLDLDSTYDPVTGFLDDIEMNKHSYLKT